MIAAGYYSFTLVIHLSVIHSSVICQSIILFLEDNLSKYQWILTKLGMCIYIVEIWFGIANVQILTIFDRFICLEHDSDGVLWVHVFILQIPGIRWKPFDVVWSS